MSDQTPSPFAAPSEGGPVEPTVVETPAPDPASAPDPQEAELEAATVTDPEPDDEGDDDIVTEDGEPDPEPYVGKAEDNDIPGDQQEGYEPPPSVGAYGSADES